MVVRMTALLVLLVYFVERTSNVTRWELAVNLTEDSCYRSQAGTGATC